MHCVQARGKVLDMTAQDKVEKKKKPHKVLTEAA